jgi:hypothetical protein
MKAFTSFYIVSGIAGPLVRVIMAFERRRVIEEIRSFLVKGVAAQSKSDGMVCLQIEILRNGIVPGKSLLMPSPEGVFIGLEVEKWKPVCAIPQ